MSVFDLLYLIAPLMKVDITAMPKPLPLTMNISTSSRLLLKYWATISVEQSRVNPTPTPTTVPESKITNTLLVNISFYHLLPLKILNKSY